MKRDQMQHNILGTWPYVSILIATSYIHNTDEECHKIWAEAGRRPSVIVSISTSIPLSALNCDWFIQILPAAGGKGSATKRQLASLYLLLSKSAIKSPKSIILASSFQFPITLTQFIIFQTNTILKPTSVAPSSWTNWPFIRRKIKHWKNGHLAESKHPLCEEIRTQTIWFTLDDWLRSFNNLSRRKYIVYDG